MPQKTYNTKPGTERNSFKPDVIETYQVKEESKLMDFLIMSMPQRKRTTIKNLLSHNQVAVNGVPTTQFDTPLAPDDEVKVNLSREFRVFYNRRLKLVYEDDDIIVEAKERLQHNWNNMVLSRKYLAVVEGNPDPEEGEVRSYLAENSRFEVYSTNNPEEGQLAVTRYKTLRSRNGFSLMEVSLDTGRKNQIRVHMKDLGHPITGDRRYGAKSSPIHRMALHAQTLRFVHPITRKDMNFSTPIPASFAKLVAAR